MRYTTEAKEGQNRAGQWSHVRHRLDGWCLVGHGAIVVTLRPRLNIACGPTGSGGGMHLFTQRVHPTRSFASQSRAGTRGRSNQEARSGPLVAGFEFRPSNPLGASGPQASQIEAQSCASRPRFPRVCEMAAWTTKPQASTPIGPLPGPFSQPYPPTASLTF
ncbi:hypothetical protein VTI28DRAFT_4904 [Corynascus sepedonium]